MRLAPGKRRCLYVDFYDDDESAVGRASGKPRLAVISIAHLSDAERMFLVALLLNEAVAWMRSRSGSSWRGNPLGVKATLAVRFNSSTIGPLNTAIAVIDDVELALREVADLPSCVRRRDVERLRQEVQERQLLMRIRLMTRELEG